MKVRQRVRKKSTRWMLLFIAIAVPTILPTVSIADDLSSAQKTSSSSNTQDKDTRGCTGIKYKPRNPINKAGGLDITSVKAFSPRNIKRGWMTFDHIGYKDTAFQGERHVALTDEGAMFFGYDAEPLTDLMIIDHPKGENQIINTVQAPVRADWHTLNGNGILFGCSFSGYLPDTDVNTHKGSSAATTITGYSVVATLKEVQVRQYSGASYLDIGTNFTTLYSEPKKCPGQNITVEITGNHAKVFLSTKKIFEFDLASDARGTGLVTTYEAHGCPSLSSVVMMNHTINNVDYLKPVKAEQ